ncbi:MAG: RnfABCDGE type electron transport complex subunit D [Zoogloeaceae bacterium]|jgi:electron transport complex protein RnfD|nr:RnfABCDGE type electron transport complex subunit D [Zoogloeaceae bacterium]
MTLQGSPFLHQPVRVADLMREVLLALLPGVLVFVWFVGFALVAQILLASVVALLAEALLLRLREKPLKPHLTDGSALVTAWLIALAFPPLSPWWLTTTGVLLAIVVAKQLYGGLGQNPFNPAMVAFTGCIVAFPAQMAHWPTLGLTAPLTEQLGVIFGVSAPLDALTGATPLSVIKASGGSGLYTSIQDILTQQSLSGAFAGKGWEWVATAYLVGGLWLLYRRVITWQAPLAFLGGMALLSFCFWQFDSAHYANPVFQLFSGGAMLGAFFIVTDPVSSCTTPRGKLIFGCGAGMLAYLIRVFGAFPDGIGFAVLIMNVCAPLIDRYTQPPVFGAKKGKGGGNA